MTSAKASQSAPMCATIPFRFKGVFALVCQTPVNVSFQGPLSGFTPFRSAAKDQQITFQIACSVQRPPHPQNLQHRSARTTVMSRRDETELPLPKGDHKKTNTFFVFFRDFPPVSTPSTYRRHAAMERGPSSCTVAKSDAQGRFQSCSSRHKHSSGNSSTCRCGSKNGCGNLLRPCFLLYCMIGVVNTNSLDNVSSPSFFSKYGL